MNPTTNSISDRGSDRSRTVADLTERNIETIVQCEERTRKSRKKSEIIAENITKFCGSTTFVWVHIVWFGGWILTNLTLPQGWRWDPIPFPFLTLVVSLEAIFLSTFILITENQQAALAERRAHLDLQINLLAEQENTKMLDLLERIAAKVGVASKADPEMKAMQETTRPQEVLEQIDRSIEANSNDRRSRQ